MKAKGITKETILDIGCVDRGFPKFTPGDAIRVAQRIVEGDKERTQYFEGDVIAINKNGIASTFTIRRIGANGVAVERIFPFHSPLIESIEFIREGDTRRAKLYFMRERIGKGARVKELVSSRVENGAANAATETTSEQTEQEPQE